MHIITAAVCGILISDVIALLAPTTLALPLLRRDLLFHTLASIVTIAPAIATTEDVSKIEWRDPRWNSLGLAGTSLPIRSVEAAAQEGTIGPMGLYPDPILRRTGAPVTKFSPSIEKVANLLIAGMKGNAISAVQYGIDARIIVLKGPASPNNAGAPLVLVNPNILARSGEERMVTWTEYCLLLPPNLEVDLLRDEVVEVAAQDVTGKPIRVALRGEASRAFQHELDHLNGILIIDHAGLDELTSAIAQLEAPYHVARQRRAFERSTYQGNEPLYY